MPVNYGNLDHIGTRHYIHWSSILKVSYQFDLIKRSSKVLCLPQRHTCQGRGTLQKFIFETDSSHMIHFITSLKVSNWLLHLVPSSAIEESTRFSYQVTVKVFGFKWGPKQASSKKLRSFHLFFYFVHITQPVRCCRDLRYSWWHMEISKPQYNPLKLLKESHNTCKQM